MNDFTLQAKTKSQLAIQDKKVKKPLAKKKSQLAIKDKKPIDKDVLLYKHACKLPRYYGSVSIYTSLAESLWRVKPGPGRRDELKFKFNTAPRIQWAALVKHVKSLPQQS